MRTYDAKVNGKSAQVSYYEPGGRKMASKSILGDLGDLLGPQGLGAMGFAPLVLLPWGLVVLVSAVSGYVIYKGYKALKEKGPDLEKVLEGIVVGGPYIAGAVATNYVGKHLPPRIAKHRWIPAAGLAGYGTYLIIKELTQPRPSEGKVLSKLFEIKKAQPPVKEGPFKDAWTRINKSIKILEYFPSIKEEPLGSGKYWYNFKLKLENTSDRDYELEVWLAKANIEAGAVMTGTAKYVLPGKGAKATLKAGSTHAWKQKIPASTVQLIMKRRGKLTYKYAVFSALDKEYKWPVKISGPIPVEKPIRK